MDVFLKPCRWKEARGYLLELCRSIGAFLLGLLLATVYGLMGLFVLNQELWFCVYVTVGLAIMAGFGMGLFFGVRANIMLMLPTCFSAKGRTILLYLITSLLLRGPLNNAIINFEVATDSVLCGMDLARNQTQELMQHAANPLFSALDNIRELTRNAYAVAGRVQNLIQALTENVRHVARTLRNVQHFLVDVGDMCNEKLGRPYKKCMSVFQEAQEDCSELLGIFNFMCDIVDGFRHLCGLARAGELFCIIPSYIARHLKEKLAAPTIAAFERMKQEFEFNISASVKIHQDINSSQSLEESFQKILGEVSMEAKKFQLLKGIYAYVGLFFLAFTYFRAAIYRSRYLWKDDFDNIYITEGFEELDHHHIQENRTPVLPLSKRETSSYIKPLSLHLTPKERRAVLKGLASVIRHLAMGGLVVALDIVTFWMLDLVHQHAQGDVIARAPFYFMVLVNGTGHMSDIFKDMLASFNILQGGNITIINKKCLLEPVEPDYTGYVIIGVLYGLVMLLTLTGGYMQRCRRQACAFYHPKREHVKHAHQAYRHTHKTQNNTH